VVDKQVIVTTIISVLSSGGLILSGFTFISQDIIKPDIQIKIIPNDINKRSALVEVRTMDGSLPQSSHY
jgi:hypothetical protein